jgi:hypothetical protein
MFRAALDRNPSLLAAWVGLGSCLVRDRRYGAAAEAFRRLLALARPSPWWPVPGRRTDRSAAVPTNTIKLRHDIEQIAHGRRHGVLGPEFDPILAAYRRALGRFEAEHGRAATHLLDPADAAAIGHVHGRIVHWRPPERLAGGALAAGWDRAEAEARFLEGQGITWVDGLLSEEALDRLRRFCLEATIWNDISHNFQADAVARGYLGAYMADGFQAPLLFQIADELAQALPALFKDHRLRQMWAYKYEDRLEGITLHGDDAAVNVNFWITPGAANLDPESGGLVVFPAKAPKEWDFDRLNRDPEAIRRFLEASGAQAVAIPYRQNRAVIFDSDLLHATAPLRFKPGYENRRVNVTMLFGKRR